ncbi:hypothetical protein Tco_1078482 [Tanacetum coccineum]|uniref:Uncharacterized protein n=1 Tax=Tanacetum coccineum TaxID=301880 RepID=A0ABQ5HQQ9_9ASTR
MQGVAVLLQNQYIELGKQSDELVFHHIPSLVSFQQPITNHQDLILEVKDHVTMGVAIRSECEELVVASILDDTFNFYQTVDPNVAKLFHIDSDGKPPSLVPLKNDSEKVTNHGMENALEDMVASSDSLCVAAIFIIIMQFALKGELGGNAILYVSIAACETGATEKEACTFILLHI